MSEIKVGDVVRLKSGGPEMTTYEVVPFMEVSADAPAKRITATVHCVWFDHHGVHRTDRFDERCLVEVVTAKRAEEKAALVRHAAGVAARRMMMAVCPSGRIAGASEAETQRWYESARDKIADATEREVLGAADALLPSHFDRASGSSIVDALGQIARAGGGQ